MHKFCILGLIFCVGIINGASAMDLSLNDAVEKILAESNDLKKADANLKQASAQLDAVNANRWFNISANASYMNLINVERPFESYAINLPAEWNAIAHGIGADMSRIDVPDNIFMAGVNVSQPIYTFGKIGHAVDSVRSAIKMGEKNKELTRREVRYSAIDLYWTAKMTDEIVKIAAADLRDAKNARASLTSAGRANRGNLVKIESDIATKQINLSNAEFNRDTAHRMLKILAGIDVNTEIKLTDEFPDTFADLNAEQLKTTPQWEILNDQIQMYEHQAKSKRAENYPTLAAVGSYSYLAMSPRFRDMFGPDNSQSAYWGLNLSVPLFTGGANRANATVSAMQAEAARQDLDKAKKIQTEQYNNAIMEYDHLRNNLATLQNARNLAAKAYKFSSDRFVSGQTSAIELAEVSAGLYQLDMALLNSKYKIIMAAESVKKLGE